MTTVQVSLRIWGDAPAIAALRNLGLGEVWAKGDPVPGSPVMLRKEGGWELHSELTQDHELEEQLGSLLRRLHGCWPELVSAATFGGAELSVALFVGRGAQPAVRLNAEQVRALAEIGADLDLDLYNWERTPI